MNALKALLIVVLSGIAVIATWNTFEWRDAYAEQGAALIVVQASKAEITQQVAAGEDVNVYTATFARAFCAQDGAAVLGTLDPASTISRTYVEEAAFYAKELDGEYAAFKAQLDAVTTPETADVAASLAASFKAKIVASQEKLSAAGLLQAEIKLPEGTTCTMAFIGSYATRDGAYAAIYVVTYTRVAPEGAPSTWGSFFILTAGADGITEVQ